MKNVYDIIVCPKCGSGNTYKYDVDKDEFNNIRHYKFFCKCQNCKTTFVKNMYVRKITDII